MNIRNLYPLLVGCAFVLPACSKGNLGGGFPGWDVMPSASDDDEDDNDDDDADEDEDASDDDDDGVVTTGPGLTSGPGTSGGPPLPQPPDAGGDGDCCSGNGTPGCDDSEIETCVCAQDDFCCTMEWDDLCASLTVELGCAACEDPGGEDEGGDTGDGGDAGDAGDATSTTTGGGGGDDGGPIGFGDCCVANLSPGCEDADVESCVCDQDSYCCETDWDSICVDEVEEFGCGVCPGGGTTTGGFTTTGGDESTGGDATTTSGGTSTGGDGGEECCSAHLGLGCDDESVETCVCDLDAYCCDTAWDSLCVSEVEDFGCGTCV